ncbi:MAG TPA: hypothetical protein VG324_12495 [Blastocatellia bacterium]|nr:hypothetical protein [Blastocatellia bacterium]
MTEPERIKNIAAVNYRSGYPKIQGRGKQMDRTTDLKTVEVTTSLLIASRKLEKYGDEAGAGINPGTLFDVRQSLIGVFLIVNKLKTFRENPSATAMIHQQTVFALELIRDWPEDEHLGAARSELRKIADGLAFVTDMGSCPV